jgi:hypothetical protein
MAYTTSRRNDLASGGSLEGTVLFQHRRAIDRAMQSRGYLWRSCPLLARR